MEPILKNIDLHVHTTYSDGSFKPAEAVQYAKKMDLAAIGITDHDITDGIPEAIEEGKTQGIEIIPGVELSSGIGNNQELELHILGYFINFEDQPFQETLLNFRKARLVRAQNILKKLSKEGVYLKESDIFKDHEKGSIGRLHFAKVMLEQEYVKDISEAFKKYLGYNKPAYVPKYRLKVEEAIKMILRVGGIPVLAHPVIGSYHVKNILKDLVNFGLKGIEVWHIKHPPVITEEFTQIGNKLGLVLTGGSDCHGQMVDGSAIMGKVNVPYSVLDGLKRAKQDIDKENMLKNVV
ncbi:MAG: PHP domain-containing protein [Elusimicrobia bacterium]|nr:PHP domain-containing protein [Candidatus Liberimonas magnetica]